MKRRSFLKVSLLTTGALLVGVGCEDKSTAVSASGETWIPNLYVRINPDGSVPQGNPFIGQKDAQLIGKNDVPSTLTHSLQSDESTAERFEDRDHLQCLWHRLVAALPRDQRQFGMGNPRLDWRNPVTICVE